AAVPAVVPRSIVLLVAQMFRQLHVQRPFQDCLGYLLQQAVFANYVFRLLVVGQQLFNEFLIDCHRSLFSSPDSRLHSPFYTLTYAVPWCSFVSFVVSSLLLFLLCGLCFLSVLCGPSWLWLAARCLSCLRG